MYKATIISVVLFVGMVTFSNSFAGSEMLPTNSHPTIDAYDGWRVGIQAWTFNRFTLYEAIDKTASLGLDWIEAYPHGQKLSKDKPNIVFGHEMPVEIREEVTQKLADAGVK